MAIRIRRAPRTSEIWPGFVDALSTLLMVIIFLLVVFMLAHNFLTVTLSGRDEALDRLDRQVAELAELLSLEQKTTADLRAGLAELAAQFDDVSAERDDLSTRLLATTIERDDLSTRLLATTVERDALELRLKETTVQAAAAQADAEALRTARAEAQQTNAADRDTLEVALAEIESLRRDIATLRAVRADLEGQVRLLATSLDERNQRIANLETESGAVRDRARELEARLADEAERTSLAQSEIKERDIRLNELRLALQQGDEELTQEKEFSAQANARIELLNQQIVALRQQLKGIAEALEAAEKMAAEQKVVISDLGRRLNVALASKVEELQRYRSEFFGRLRTLLGGHPGIRIEGDRFVFQSDVLFASGSAQLDQRGKVQMGQLANTLLDIARHIPRDISWILRVDGHTDKVPIRTSQFQSNWELSTARAISVLRFLVESGVPPNRLAATGFGEFQPIDARDDEIAYRRNRRIELKLTNR
jgi:chemotaxis protein MotB